MMIPLFFLVLLGSVSGQSSQAGTQISRFSVKCDSIVNGITSKGENPCTAWGLAYCNNYELEIPSTNQTIRYTYCSGADKTMIGLIVGIVGILGCFILL